MRLTEKDKGSIIALIFIIAVVVVSVIFYKGSKLINPFALGIFTLVVQYLVLVPYVVKMYYQINAYRAKFDRFIPLWNEASLFPPKLAVITLITWAAAIVAGVMSVLNPDAVATIFGMKVALNYNITMLRVLAVILLINNGVRGYALFKFGRTLELINSKVYRRKKTKRNVVFVVMQGFACFVPLLRIIPTLMFWNNLNRLVNCNKYTKKAR